MGRKNRRIVEDSFLEPIKPERRAAPRCDKFPRKTVFTTGYRAQVAVDDKKAESNRERVPERVYECLVAEGGCGFFHITGEQKWQPKPRKDDYLSDYYWD